MRIQHNISALNAHRQLGVNNTAVGKNLEKLSSGFRINRAGDDAAGLAISEKMRGQIRGLDMAARNANDGISLIQTAEGALNETHSILQRMRELAVQSSNGTYEEGVDRVQLDKEVTALKAEVDRISSSTHFNNQKLLNGELGVGGANPPAAAVTTTGYVAGKFATTATNSITSLDIAVADVGHGDSLTIGDKTIMFWGDATVGANTGVNAAAKAPTVASGVILINLNTTTAADKESLADAIIAAGAPTGFTATKAGATDLDDTGTAITADTLIFKATTAGVAGGNIGQIKFTKADGTNGTFTQATELTAKDAVAATRERFATATVDASSLLGVKADDAVNTISIASGGNTVNLNVVTADAYEKLSDANKLLSVKEGYSLQDVADKINATAATTTDNVTVSGTSMTFSAPDAQTDTAAEITAFANAITLTGKPTTPKTDGVTFQIGANGTADDRVNLIVANQNTTTLGIDSISIATQDEANAAIDKISRATNLVSGTRADLGALQNRLEHTVANLGVSVENLTAAESRIRDVDMAKEMMEMTKNNILTQAAQAMLAQANTQPQSVLQLLQ